MTTALVRRSRIFVDRGGVDVDILTFDTRRDYDEVEAQLRERGDLIAGMRLINIYDWWRARALP